MQCQKQELQRALHVINSRIIQLADVEKMHQQNFDTLADNICDIQNQKHQLEQFVFRFKNSNKKYLKVKSIAEEHVNRLLIEEETLLDLALKAAIEALRMNPDRYKIIYDSKYDSDDNVSTSAFTKPQDYYYDKYHEGLVESAKGFLKLLLNQLVDKTMVTAVKADVK